LGVETGSLAEQARRKANGAVGVDALLVHLLGEQVGHPCVSGEEQDA
jgi:hypothetical protein